jgi:hypothetical protein
MARMLQLKQSQLGLGQHHWRWASSQKIASRPCQSTQYEYLSDGVVSFTLERKLADSMGELSAYPGEKISGTLKGLKNTREERLGL